MLGPGIPNPMLMSGGDPLDEYRKIERSVRFNAADLPELARTNGTPTDQTRWTAHAWVSRAALSGAVSAPILTGKSGTTSAEIAYLETTDALSYRGTVDSVGASQGSISSLAVYRDFASFMPVTVNYDASRAAAARIKLFVEDVELSLNVAVNIGTCNMNTAGATLKIGRRQYNTSPNDAFNGYLADIRFIDGQALSPSAFGTRHPRTGQWRPTPYAGTYGNNGFHLDFKDGSAATSGALGKDRSGNNNDFTPANISVAAGTGCDWVQHSPTNVFCTLNPLAWRNGSGQPNYSNGNLDVTNPSGVFATFSLGTMPLPSWETYFEATVLAVGVNTPLIGVADRNILTSDFTNQFAYQLSGQKQAGSATPTAYGAAYTTGDVIGVRVKPSANEVEFYKQTGGAGAFVSQGVIALNAGVEYFAYVQLNNNGKLALNFGQRAFNNPSPPAGAQPNSTKLLPVKPFGPMKSASAFVAVKDTGANILSTLAAARTSWSAWIDIIKRSDPTAEGWRWIFSDDPGNYIDSASTAAKAAVPAFAGSAYAGWSLKVSAANGVATGTFVHTNGANSVVSDGLSNARKMVILLRESAGGGSRYVYHPELTAGKLMYLEQKTAETTDASINTVTASGFTAASTLPSGTYRWISIAETPDFIKLWRSIGNGTSTDGRFAFSCFPPALDLCKRADVAAPWSVHDTARSANVNVLELQLNATQGENSATDPDPAAIDLVSNGTKVRTNMGDTNAAYSNANGGAYIGLSIAAFPFRYANAR